MAFGGLAGIGSPDGVVLTTGIPCSTETDAVVMVMMGVADNAPAGAALTQDAGGPLVQYDGCVPGIGELDSIGALSGYFAVSFAEYVTRPLPAGTTVSLTGGGPYGGRVAVFWLVNDLPTGPFPREAGDTPLPLTDDCGGSYLEGTINVTSQNILIAFGLARGYTECKSDPGSYLGFDYKQPFDPVEVAWPFTTFASWQILGTKGYECPSGNFFTDDLLDLFRLGYLDVAVGAGATPFNSQWACPGHADFNPAIYNSLIGNMDLWVNGADPLEGLAYCVPFGSPTIDANIGLVEGV